MYILLEAFVVVKHLVLLSRSVKEEKKEKNKSRKGGKKESTGEQLQVQSLVSKDRNAARKDRKLII